MPIITLHVDPGTELGINDVAEKARAKNPKAWPALSSVAAGLIRAAIAAGLDPLPSPVKRGRSRAGDAQGRILRMVGREGRVSFERAVAAGAPDLDRIAVLNLIRNGTLAWAPDGQVMLGIMGVSARGMWIDDPIGGGPSEHAKGGWATQIMGEVPPRPRRERAGLAPGEHYQGCPLAGVSDDVSCCR